MLLIRSPGFTIFRQPISSIKPLKLLASQPDRRAIRYIMKGVDGIAKVGFLAVSCRLTSRGDRFREALHTRFLKHYDNPKVVLVWDRRHGYCPGCAGDLTIASAVGTPAAFSPAQ